MPQPTTPADPTSAANLAARGLHYALVDTGDAAAFEVWMRSDIRGFHAADLAPDVMDASLAGVAYRRTTGVWDGDEPEPVATVSSWPAELSVPGEATVIAWAISSVTVAPTHRRQGIATALLEGELRTAAAQGIPLAILTVSESTIYGRWGFAPGAFATTLRIDPRRARWTGDRPAGSVRFVSREVARDLIESLHDSARPSSPGEIDMWGLRWDQMLGFHSDDADRTKDLRAVAYRDEAGEVRGLAVYRVSGGDDDYTSHTLTVEHLVSTTPDAYSALWRFVLEVDLVKEVKADLRSVDEPLIWQVSDQRGIVAERVDHLWLRILDVAATLESRTWTGPARIALRVSDSLGFAEGTFLLDVDVDGTGRVTRTDEASADAASVALSVGDLSALYLGGVSAVTLAHAGLLSELTEGAAAAVDRAFRSPTVPWLSVWF